MPFPALSPTIPLHDPLSFGGCIQTGQVPALQLELLLSTSFFYGCCSSYSHHLCVTASISFLTFCIPTSHYSFRKLNAPASWSLIGAQSSFYPLHSAPSFHAQQTTQITQATLLKGRASLLSQTANSWKARHLSVFFSVLILGMGRAE